MIRKVAWLLSLLVTAILILIIGHIIYNTHHSYKPYPEQLNSNQKTIAYIQNFIKKYYASQKDLSIQLVPTGLYIESLRLSTPYTVHMSGYLWQKYRPTYLQNYEKGFVFPGATSLTIQKAFEKKEGDSLVLGWHFDGDFMQPFDYSKYPLDYKVVRLRIWPKDLEKPIILTPDLESYSAKSFHKSFGLDPRIVLEGYSVLETFFSFELSDYDTNFGLKYDIETKDFPELYFNIPLKRNILSAFMVNLLPLSIVLILSFSLLHMMTNKAKTRKKYGFNLSGLTNVCAAMLFVVLLGHIRLRELIVFGSVIYLEFIYFIVYFALIYITALGFLVMKNRSKKASWIDFLFYDDCLLLKVLYLPLIFGLILSVTVEILA